MPEEKITPEQQRAVAITGMLSGSLYQIEKKMQNALNEKGAIPEELKQEYEALTNDPLYKEDYKAVKKVEEELGDYPSEIKRKIYLEHTKQP